MELIESAAPRRGSLSLLAKLRLRRTRTRGQSMVEFALTAPLVFFLLFGIVDFGRALFYENEITNAAREGARVALLASNPCNTVVGSSCSNSVPPAAGSVCQAVTNEGQLISTFSGCSDPSSAVPPCTSNCAAFAGQAYVAIAELPTTCSSTPANLGPRSGGNKPVKVSIVYYYRPLTPFLASYFPNNFYLFSSTCVREEY